VWFPDEHRIALGCADGAIQVWDAFAGTLLATWKQAAPETMTTVASEFEPPHAIFDLHWSPDARYLIYGSQDGMAEILDGENGHVVHQLARHSTSIWRVSWSPNGQRVATTGQDGMVRVFAADSGGQVAQITHGFGTAEVDSLDWSPDGRQMLSAGFDSTLRIRDAQRGARLDAIDQLIARKKDHPKDLETLRHLAQSYMQLGWVDDARLTFGLIHSIAPDDAGSRLAAADAETAFARALETPSNDWMESSKAIGDRRHALELLDVVQECWDSGQSEVAIAAYRELAHVGSGSSLLPYAQNYLSRAHWTATWFTSGSDPLGDLSTWRGLAHEGEAVSVQVNSLAFPYQNAGPKALNIDPELSERGPGVDHFGMIAKAIIKFPAGRWRFHAAGGGGVRVIADGKAVLDVWTADAPTEKFGDFETKSTKEVQLTVEHFVATPTSTFQFIIEPLEK
jgi:hypothetical protein